LFRSPSTLDIVTGSRKKRQSKKSPLVKAQERLQWLCYFGVGEKYLGECQAEYELQDDGSEACTQGFEPRRWRWDKRKAHPHDQYKEIREHRLNCRNVRKNGLRGVCRDVGETHVPFIKLDGDRHSAQISVPDHLREAVALYSEAKRHPLCSWLSEVNPNDGSVSFFGFIGRRPIPEDKAKQEANSLKERLEQRGVKVEVFPSTNCPQARLPWRPDKVYILGNKVYQPGDDQLLLDFWTWDGSLPSWTVIKGEILKACANLPYVAPSLEPVIETVEEPVVTEQISLRKPPRSIQELKNEPNAFIRKSELCRIMLRQTGGKLSLDEFEKAYREYGLFSAPWTNPKRRRELASVLAFTKQGFAPEKCQGRTTLRGMMIEPSRFGKRNSIGLPKKLPLQKVRQFDPETMTCPTKMVKVSRVFFRKVADMTYHFLAVQPEANDGVATERFRGNWNKYEPQIKWDTEKYQASREYLDRMGVIEIYDRRHAPDKCWRWRLPASRKPSVFALVLAAIIQWLTGITQKQYTTNQYKYLCARARFEIGFEPSLMPDFGLPPPRGSPKQEDKWHDPTHNDANA
jgi:hypothetical protein